MVKNYAITIIFILQTINGLPKAQVPKLKFPSCDQKLVVIKVFLDCKK